MLSGQVIGSEQAVSYLGVVLPPRAKDQVRARVSRLAMLLLRKVKAEKLSGQVLKNQTGTLRRSINQRVQDAGGVITGSVGTNLSYARAHELGVDMHKMVTVRAYMRRNIEAGIAAWRIKHKMPVPMVLVHSFQRNQHIKLPERSFLRSALDEMRPQIREELVDALRVALRGGK